jgi:hypothetical protein
MFSEMSLSEPFTGSKSTSPENTCFQENMFSTHRKNTKKHEKTRFLKKHVFIPNFGAPSPPPHPPPQNRIHKYAAQFVQHSIAAMYKLQRIKPIYTSIYMLYEIKYRNRNKTKVQKVMRKYNSLLFFFYILFYLLVFYLL